MKLLINNRNKPRKVTNTGFLQYLKVGHSRENFSRPEWCKESAEAITYFFLFIKAKILFRVLSWSETLY